ncbi:hypothetical protein ACNKHQ_06350 [Shigella flexneri]
MSRQRLSPSLGESKPPRLLTLLRTCTVRVTTRIAVVSILRLIEEEALKENTKQVHAIVPVPIASYLLNESAPLSAPSNPVRAMFAASSCQTNPMETRTTPYCACVKVKRSHDPELPATEAA